MVVVSPMNLELPALLGIRMWVERIPISFTEPLFLLLLPLLGAFYWLATRKRPAPRGPWPLSLWLRLGVALLVIMALAGLRVPAPAKSVATVFVVDLSASVPADIQEGAKSWVRQAIAVRGPDDLVGVVSFGAEPRVELPLGKARDLAEWGAPPPGNGSNLGAALRLAADLLPPAGSGPLRRLVLLSDGNETEGDVQRSLLRPQMRDVEVAVLALPQRLQDTAITTFLVPPALREGEPAEARIALHSADQQSAALRIWAEAGDISKLLYERTLQLELGPREVVVDLGDLPKGAWAFRAELSVPNDSLPENNQSWSYTVVQDAPRVLLVEGVAGESALVRQSLVDAKVQVDTVAPAQTPAQMDRLLEYEAVVLINVHARDLQRSRMELLRDYVSSHGRGLVVIGGEQTFGEGEYADSPLEAALPVTVQPPDREQAATLALVLVIDRSGSMAATDTGDRRTSRMDLAKEGAIQAVETLSEGDQVGVIAFDYDARWIVNVAPVRSRAETRAVADRIATIQPDGGTDIYRAMELAYQGLRQTSARVKHVILLTDGEQGSPAPFAQLTTAMRRQGITVSTLGIASTGSAATTLQNIARIGQGRFYATTDARDVPRIMTQEARLAGRSFKQEREFKPRLATGTSAVRGFVPAEFPQLHGYMRVSPKPGSETVLTSDQEEVILAQWQYGLGRSVVWTADASGEWSKDWAAADHFRRLWPQVVRWAMPAPVVPGIQVGFRADGPAAHLRVESFETGGEFRNHLETYADIVFPQPAAGSTNAASGRRILLPQTAPGRYEGRLNLVGPGVYFVHVTQADSSGEVIASQTTGYALPHLAEYRVSASNRALLERLAADTGGPIVSRVDEAWLRNTTQRLQPQDVWNYLIMAALILFVVDVAARRIQPRVTDLRDTRNALRRRTVGWQMPRVSLPTIRLHPLQGGKR
jgi:Ca-activated chloride channel homolog